MAMTTGKHDGPKFAPGDISFEGLRVVFCTSNFDGKSDGVTLTLSRVIQHIRSLGAKVLVITLEYEQPEVVPPVRAEVDERVHSTMYVRASSGYSVGLYTAEVEEAMERFRPHLMHFVSPCPLSCACLRWAIHRGLPVVGSYHTNFPFLFSSHFLLAPFTTAVRNIISWSYGGMCNRILVPTQTIINQLADEEGLDRSRMIVWGRGVETSHFGTRYRTKKHRQILQGKRRRDESEEERDADEVEEERVEEVEEDDVPVLLFVGRLVPEKNLAAVAETFTLLRARGVRHHAVVVGSGSHEEWLRERCPEETRFLGHVRNLEELGRYYASADVFFFPSIFETFGRVTIEAMASGLPVVAGKGGGSMDLVEDGVDGYLVDATDSEAFADRCQTLLEDKAFRKEMAENCVKKAAKFQWGPIMDLLVETYKETIAEVANRRQLDRWEDVDIPKTPPPGLEGFTALDEDGGFIRWATAGRWAVGGWDEGVEGGAAPAAADSSVLWWLGGGMWEGLMGGTSRASEDEAPSSSFLSNSCGSARGGGKGGGEGGSSAASALLAASGLLGSGDGEGGGHKEASGPGSGGSRSSTSRASRSMSPTPPPHLAMEGKTGALGQPKQFTGSDDGYGPIASIFAAWFGTESEPPPPTTPTTPHATPVPVSE